KRQGYDVAVAESGVKALKTAVDEDPNLIILDVMMPDMNGLEVCRNLRANESTAEIPIIMFTAKTMIDDKVKGYEAGADDYLTKHTHPAELANRIKSVLQRKTGISATQTMRVTRLQPLNKSASTQSASEKLGKLIGVMGVKGGVGTTVLSAFTPDSATATSYPCRLSIRLINLRLSASSSTMSIFSVI
ncbi:MAG: response regulator, partial [Chloroflexota bacterium]